MYKTSLELNFVILEQQNTKFFSYLQQNIKQCFSFWKISFSSKSKEIVVVFKIKTLIITIFYV